MSFLYNAGFDDVIFYGFVFSYCQKTTHNPRCRVVGVGMDEINCVFLRDERRRHSGCQLLARDESGGGGGGKIGKLMKQKSQNSVGW